MMDADRRSGMEKTTAMSRSPRFLQRSISGTSRLCHVVAPDSPLFAPNRPRSTAKSRPVASALRRGRKENREEIVVSPPKNPIAERRPAPSPKSAWALSPGRSPTDPAREKRRGGVLGFLRQRKTSPEKEETAHRLRLMTSKLIQWRFANARAEAAMIASHRSAERKLFFSLLRINELRNIVTAKRILIQRRRHKMKLLRILGPQIQLLNRWESIAKKNAEAMGALTRVLRTASISVPLIEGAQVDIILVREQICKAMGIMENVENVLRFFYGKMEKICLLVDELGTTIRSEVVGLEELLRTSKEATLLEMHGISLRASVIQAKKEMAVARVIPALHQTF